MPAILITGHPNPALIRGKRMGYSGRRFTANF
jgi:hypothetical protein